MTFLRDWLSPLVGEGAALTVSYIVALLAVLLLLVLVLLAYRWLSGGRLLRRGRGHAPRLGIVDAMPVDSRRKLVLVRRDNVEHLILIGGTNDLIVEPTIQRGAPPARRPADPVRAPAPPPAVAPAKPAAAAPGPTTPSRLGQPEVPPPPPPRTAPAASTAPAKPVAGAGDMSRQPSPPPAAIRPSVVAAPQPPSRPPPTMERGSPRATLAPVREAAAGAVTLAPPERRVEEAPPPVQSPTLQERGPRVVATNPAPDQRPTEAPAGVQPTQRAWPFPRAAPAEPELELEHGVTLEDYASWEGPVIRPAGQGGEAAAPLPMAPSPADRLPDGEPADTSVEDERRASRVTSLENEMARLLGEIAGKKP